MFEPLAFAPRPSKPEPVHLCTPELVKKLVALAVLPIFAQEYKEIDSAPVIAICDEVEARLRIGELPQSPDDDLGYAEMVRDLRVLHQPDRLSVDDLYELADRSRSELCNPSNSKPGYEVQVLIRLGNLVAAIRERLADLSSFDVDNEAELTRANVLYRLANALEGVPPNSDPTFSAFDEVDLLLHPEEFEVPKM